MTAAMMPIKPRIMKKEPMLNDPSKMLDYSNYLYAAAAILTLVATFGVIYFGRAATKLKDAQVKQYQKEADTRIAEANARSAEANAKAAQADNSAAGANQLASAANAQAKEAQARAEVARATAEQSRLDKANIERDNLVLQAKVESERQARLVIEQKLAPRDLGSAAQRFLIAALGPKQPGKPVVTEHILYVTYPGDAEAQHLAGEYAYVFNQLHWTVSRLSPISGSTSGVVVSYRKGDIHAQQAATLIVQASRSAGLQTSEPTAFEADPISSFGSSSTDGDPGLASIRLVVGSK